MKYWSTLWFTLDTIIDGCVVLGGESTKGEREKLVTEDE
jgi:hypothetical protein